MYKFLFRHFFVKLDAEWVHDRVLAGLAFWQRFRWSRAAASHLAARPQPRFPWPLPRPDATGRSGIYTSSLTFGPLGLAAGMDKTGKALEMWHALGFGFVEIGTITPLPQPGNERPRLWRIPQRQALRNAMGFNNEGARAAARRLKYLRSRTGRDLIIGANIGKNKTTPPEKAASDYRKVTRSLAALVDFLVINVSSPNTPGLRDLQMVESLTPIVRAVFRELRAQNLTSLPVFVKIAPDLDNANIVAIANLVCAEGLAGVVATNTTIDHDLGAGGLSGAPLRQRALEVVRLLRQNLPADKVIIGVGGITTAAQARDMMNAGANLVEGLSAFIYEGPKWASRINRELS